MRILAKFTGDLAIAFRVDGMGMVFAGLVSFLWPLATLFSFEYMITLAGNHPLADYKEITPSMLKKYTEIALEDDGDNPLQPKKGKGGKRQIFIYDRGSQFELLTSIPGAYMFTSPIPDKLLKAHGLIQKDYPCPYGKLQDVLIYPKGYKFSNTEKLFLHELKETIHTLKKFHP